MPIKQHSVSEDLKTGSLILPVRSLMMDSLDDLGNNLYGLDGSSYMIRLKKDTVELIQRISFKHGDTDMVVSKLPIDIGLDLNKINKYIEKIKSEAEKDDQTNKNARKQFNRIVQLAEDADLEKIEDNKDSVNPVVLYTYEDSPYSLRVDMVVTKLLFNFGGQSITKSKIIMGNPRIFNWPKIKDFIKLIKGSVN